MCEPISIGIAIGASVGAIGAAATSGDVLQGALIGGVMGGVTGGMGVTAGSTSMSGVIGGATLGSTTFVTGLGANIALGGVASAAGVGLIGGAILNPMLNPKTPDYSGYTPVSQYGQQFNSQQIATTGSGGRQATASLAQAISRSKQRKLSQADVSDLSIDTSSFAFTVLQFA